MGKRRKEVRIRLTPEAERYVLNSPTLYNQRSGRVTDRGSKILNRVLLKFLQENFSEPRVYTTGDIADAFNRDTE